MKLKEVFGDELKGLKIDDKLAKKIQKFTQGFISKNENHILFFGRGLVGTPKIAFLPTDRAEWFEEVLDIDESTLKSKLKDVDDVNTSFHVTGDAFNLSIVYMVHAFTNSRNCSKRRSEDAQRSLMMLIQYKFLTSLMNNNFPHEADEGTAVATYASLNKRFSLKVHGSWNTLIRYRAEDVISKDSIHRVALNRFDNDIATVYVLSDVQTRIRDVVKLVVGVFHDVRKNDARILSSDTLSVFDGEEKLGAKTDAHTKYREGILRAVNEKGNFIKEEITEIITGYMHTLPPKLLIESLEYITDNYGNRRADYLDELLNDTVLYALEYISKNDWKVTDFRRIIPGIRKMFMASKATNDDLLHIRELADKLVNDSVSSKNTTVKASCRTGVLLYITLRALTARHYD